MLAVIGRCKSGQNVVLWLQPIWLVIIMHERLGSCSLYLHRSAESPSIRFGLMSFWNEQFPSLTYPLSYLTVALLLYIHCSSEDLIHLSFFFLLKFCIKTESSKSWMHISLITYIQPKSSIAQLCLGHAVHHEQNRSPQWLVFGGWRCISPEFLVCSSQSNMGRHSGLRLYIFLWHFMYLPEVFFVSLCCQFAFMLYVLFFYCENMLLYQRHRCGLCGRLHVSAG